MLCKAAMMGDRTSFELIRKEKEPKEVKRLGRRVVPFHEERWKQCICCVAFHAVFQKFSNSSVLSSVLLDTEEKIIAETTKRDLIWGIGYDMGDPHVRTPSEWTGCNVLGWTLMQVRSTLRLSPLDLPILSIGKEVEEASELQRSELLLRLTGRRTIKVLFMKLWKFMVQKQESRYITSNPPVDITFLSSSDGGSQILRAKAYPSTEKEGSMTSSLQDESSSCSVPSLISQSSLSTAGHNALKLTKGKTLPKDMQENTTCPWEPQQIYSYRSVKLKDDADPRGLADVVLLFYEKEEYLVQDTGERNEEEMAAMSRALSQQVSQSDPSEEDFRSDIVSEEGGAVRIPWTKHGSFQQRGHPMHKYSLPVRSFPNKSKESSGDAAVAAVNRSSLGGC